MSCAEYWRHWEEGLGGVTEHPKIIKEKKGEETLKGKGGSKDQASPKEYHDVTTSVPKDIF